MLDNYAKIETTLPQTFLTILNNVVSGKVAEVFARFDIGPLALGVGLKTTGSGSTFMQVWRVDTWTVISKVIDLEKIFNMWPEVFAIPYGNWYYYKPSPSDTTIYNLHDDGSHGSDLRQLMQTC